MAPSIVDKLVRAAAAVPADIPDDELNRHVADILAKEAKEKESKWREMGIGAYLDDTSGGSSSRAPKPNTRFLKSLVRDVDGHNTALLREQANAARAAAADKFYQESNSRSERDGRGTDRDARSRPRNGEDSDVARMKRLFGGAVGSAASSRQSDSRARRDVGESSRGHGSEHRDSRQPQSASASTSRGAAGSWRREAMGDSSSRYNHEDEASEDEEKGWSRKDVGRSKPRSALQRAQEEEAGERKRARKEEDRQKERERDRAPAPSARRRDYDDVPGVRLPPPDMTSSAPTIPSKMDRYFEPTYDPTKDYRAMLDAQDVAVPRTGLIPDVDIGWDAMLSTIKYRGQAKESGRERAREKERAEERDRNAREWERERERQRAKTTTSDSKRRRRDDRSPSIISIPDSSQDSSDDAASDSWSGSSDADRKKRRHGSSSKRKKSTSTRDKEHRSRKESSSSHKRSSKRRRYDSEEEREKKKVSVGGYEYVSKGATREWDRGK